MSMSGDPGICPLCNKPFTRDIGTMLDCIRCHLYQDIFQEEVMHVRWYKNGPAIPPEEYTGAQFKRFLKMKVFW
jgi:hypothetical protein